MKAYEVIAQKRVTEAYIREDLSQITITRMEPTRNARSGLSFTPAELLPQPMRLVKVRASQKLHVPAQGGRFPGYQDQLIAKVGADIRQADKFTHEGHNYVVVKVLRRAYETVAILESKDREDAES